MKVRVAEIGREALEPPAGQRLCAGLDEVDRPVGIHSVVRLKNGAISAVQRTVMSPAARRSRRSTA